MLSHMPEGFSIAKIEAKAGKDGSWQDVTGRGSITITGNQTVYVRVTDGEGKVYEQNRSIKCYDTEKPTLSASLTDGVLTIQGNDTVSGITSVTVNGTTYTDLKDGMLRVQLTQKDFTTKQIEITSISGTIRYRDFNLFCCKIFLCQLHSQHSILQICISGAINCHRSNAGNGIISLNRQYTICQRCRKRRLFCVITLNRAILLIDLPLTICHTHIHCLVSSDRDTSPSGYILPAPIFSCFCFNFCY